MKLWTREKMCPIMVMSMIGGNLLLFFKQKINVLLLKIMKKTFAMSFPR